MIDSNEISITQNTGKDQANLITQQQEEDIAIIQKIGKKQ